MNNTRASYTSPLLNTNLILYHGTNRHDGNNNNINNTGGCLFVATAFKENYKTETMELMKINEVPEKVKSLMVKMGMSEQKFLIEAAFACDIWNNPKNKYLRRSTDKSLLSSILNIAKTGLTLNPIAEEAYLIPRYNGVSKEIECSLEPSYKGLQKLLYDSGYVAGIQTNLVYDGDEFDVNLGMSTEITHKPFYVKGNEKGNMKGVYSIMTLTTGVKQFEYITFDEISAIRDNSESYKAFKEGKTKSAIWNDYGGEMTRKTCIKRLAKYIPKTKAAHLQNAIELDNESYRASFSQIGLIESKLGTSSIIESMKEGIEKELSIMSSSRAKDVLNYLEQNQLNPITESGNYLQSDINKQLDDVMNDERK